MNAPTPRTRDALTPVARAVSDALDDLLSAHFGITTSWSHPHDLLEDLDDAGFEVVPKRAVLSDEEAVEALHVADVRVRQGRAWGDRSPREPDLINVLRAAGIALVRVDRTEGES